MPIREVDLLFADKSFRSFLWVKTKFTIDREIRNGPKARQPLHKGKNEE